MSDDLAGQWKLSLPDGRYTIEFDHGTTSGKRVIRVNNKVNRSVLNKLIITGFIVVWYFSFQVLFYG